VRCKARLLHDRFEDMLEVILELDRETTSALPPSESVADDIQTVVMPDFEISAENVQVAKLTAVMYGIRRTFDNHSYISMGQL